ncbi:Acetophenone carboxylase delta subunit [uncultured Desulfatiglans sp.]|uniref:Acetophenone carboxylase delta subunit n=1 Tax=Uncultured Desulfatiglans sp. TaxID=1748965 RepID=A0A653AHM9_UNCDX|nr:Acetophenone carboxylase delta subunit [uncultured Desulfatiglans sp.]
MAIPTAEEKLSMIKVEPADADEMRCVDTLNPGDYEVGFERINNILDEAMEVFIRSSRSSMGVAGDSMVAVFTAKGDMGNASSGTYLHAIIQPAIIKFIMKSYSENPGIRDGDIWFTNDALYGGIHNPDCVIVMPVFFKGELIAWTGAASHTTETGASEPGGMPINANSRFLEGGNFPPIKIGEDFRIREDFLELMAAFGMRAPQMVVIDLKARATAADRARKRLVELAQEKSPDYVKGLMRKMLIVAEEGARKKIASWPDGTFTSVNFADGVGMEVGLIRSCFMTATKKGSRLTMDFTGTSPENPYSYNAHVQAVVGHISNFIYEYIFHDLPVSSATFEPFDFIFPEGSCLNPDARAATSCAVMISTGVMSALHGVFGKMMFSTKDMWQQTSASQGNAGNAMVLAGLSQWNLPFADMLAYSINSEGQGGRPTMDGVNAFGFPWCVFGRTPDVEEMELDLPLLIPLSDHWKDSCGHGKYRGGVGTVQIWVAHHAPQVFFMAIADNSKVQTPQGLFGGYAPCTVPGLSIRGADLMERMQKGDKDLNLELFDILSRKTVGGKWQNEFFGRPTTMFQKNDVVTFGFATGGAGYGDPLDREPDLVIQDLKDQIISDWSAQQVYKVVYDPQSLKLDREGTEAARKEERLARLARGKPFDEFTSEWAGLKVDDAILKFYGTWPEAQCIQPIFRP